MWINGLDDKDNQIINLLLEDGRKPFSEIGDFVGLTRVAVANRVKALENKGIIQGYKAVINPQEAPQMMTFVTNIEVSAEHFDAVKETLKNSPEVVTLVQTTGNCHLTGICVATDIKSMRDFINAIYRNVQGITSVNAHAVLDIVKGSVIPEKDLLGAHDNGKQTRNCTDII